MKFLYVFVFLLTITSCKKTTKNLTKIVANNIAIDSTIMASVEIDSMISPYKNKLNAEMKQVLCYAPQKLVKNDGNMQSTVGNLMADLCFELGNPIFKGKTNESIDFVLFNYGGIRASIPAGEIMKEDAFKLMPFENELVAVTLTGKKTAALANYFVNSKRAHPLSKNVELIINENEYDLKINGKPFDKNKSYTVLTSDYLQHGGSGMNFFKNPVKLLKLDYKIREAIIDYFKKVDTLKTAIDNRILIK